MFATRSMKLLLMLAAGFFFYSGCQNNDGTGPAFTDFGDDSFDIVDDDLAFMESTGIDTGERYGVFSIGWNQFISFRHHNQSSSAHAFAVAFEEPRSIEGGPHSRSGGIDIGEVSISYADQSVDLIERESREGGIIYSLFAGRHEPVAADIEYVPGATYKFTVSGSSDFGALTVGLIAPQSMISITSHAENQVISSGNDLVISWDGSDADKPVLIRVMGHREHLPGTRPMPHERPGSIVELVEENTGKHTIAADAIQGLLSESSSSTVSISVSQLNITEVDHNSKNYHFVMRDGDRVVLSVE